MKTSQLSVLVSVILTANFVTEANHRKQKSNSIYNLSAEGKLRRHLMGTYDLLNPARDLRPLYNSEERVNVSIGLSLKNLVKVDEASKTFTFNIWEVYEWSDDFLTWDPEDFGQHSRIELRSKDIWIPDIKLYQAFDPDSNRINTDMVDVQHTGLVTFYPVFTRNVICKEESEESVLNCVLQYGSWVYDGDQVDVNFLHGLKNISLWDFEEHADYPLRSLGAAREVSHTPCCSYPLLRFWMKFDRKTNWW